MSSNALEVRQVPALPKADITFYTGSDCFVGSSEGKSPSFELKNVAPNTCIKPGTGGTSFNAFTSAFAQAQVSNGVACKLTICKDPYYDYHCSNSTEEVRGTGVENKCISSHNWGGAQSASWTCDPPPSAQGYPSANVKLFTAPGCLLDVVGHTYENVVANLCMKPEGGLLGYGSGLAEVTGQSVAPGYQCELLFYSTTTCDFTLVEARALPGKCASPGLDAVQNFKWACGI
ncbi:hypothetical protein EK21DRAFT_94951 [Setomelanomma holmii]|uniref:Uncharacterized protein n=1 Tax=Setomelanomma holmii TaxID=210430 RepID=A0A9P4GXQ1_9PLEO|nr:hypothetical protein EK21DRAFT_94951 [Setomelanomma holmii]